MVRKAILITVLNLTVLCSFGQNFYPNMSPHTVLKQEVGYTNMEVRYDRPATRERTIFGDLVPYGKVWRTGAALATTISFDKAVTIQGQNIAAGKYSLFTVPNKDKWQVMLNSDTTLYGAYDYNAELDVASFTVQRKKSPRFYESLTFSFDIIPDDAMLYISWENTEISFLIETHTHESVTAYIRNQLFTKEETDFDRYLNGASYMLTYKMSLDSALILTNTALEIQETEYLRNVRYEIFMLQGKKRKAKQEIKATLHYIENSSYSERDKAISRKEWEGYLKEY